jgi:hypothetical protein
VKKTRRLSPSRRADTLGLALFSHPDFHRRSQNLTGSAERVVASHPMSSRTSACTVTAGRDRNASLRTLPRRGLSPEV